MDGLSGAASIITVFSLALSSTQVLYNTLSGIKNAPAAIEHMISNLQDLSNILKQLKGCTDQLYLATDLENLVGKCAADLKGFEEKLAKLSTSGDNKAVRLWKSMKAKLQERDLLKMSGLIQQHVAALSLQMQIIEGTRGSSHTASLERVEALSHTQIVLNTKSSNTLESTKTAVDQVNDKVQALGTTANVSHQITCLALEQLGNTMQQLSGLSTAQSETLIATCNSILELLKQQFSAKPQESAAKAFRHEAVLPSAAETFEEMEMEVEAHDSSDDDDGLQHALDRLCQLAKDKEKTVFSEEAEAIIQDVQHVLDLLLEAGEEESVKERKGKRPRKSFESDMMDNNLLYRQEVKRIKGLLTASHCVSINEKASRPFALATAKYKTKNTHCERRSRYGTMTVQARRKYRNIGATSQDHTSDTQSDTSEILEVSLALLPINLQTPRIAVEFQQRMSYEGSFLRKPTLSFSALLPANAEVFRLIENGDLDGLIKSLSLREAFLTDRDCEGRCLLNYALYSSRPDICKFLIDKGANVDYLEPDPVSRGRAVSSLDTFRVNDFEADPEELARVNRCRLLLFEAGADPTLCQDENFSEGYFIGSVLSTGTTESIQLFLDHGLPFVQSASPIKADLLLKELLVSNYWTVESIALLLRRQGKGGLPIQNLNGCLPTAILGSCFTVEDGLQEALILLIRAGADVYARNWTGRSVSYIACSAETIWNHGLKIYGPNYRKKSNDDLRLREIWVEALSACEYDAEEVISTSMRLEELSDRDNDSMSDEHEESVSAGSDCSKEVVYHSTCLLCGIRKPDCHCENNSMFWQTDSTFSDQYEQLLLEGDAQVWEN